MELRTLNVGCFGGGTGLPSLLGGLKSNPWLTVNAVVTMFDSGGSSGAAARRAGRAAAGGRAEVRAGAGAQRARGAARAAGAAADARARAAARAHRRQPAAVDDGAVQRRLPRRGRRAARACSAAPDACGRSASSRRSVCAEYGDGTQTRGEVEVDAGQTAGHAITRLWLEPDVRLHASGCGGDPAVRRRDHRPRAASTRA